jgi:hypothetical protein
MNHFAWIATLCLLTGLAQADTFELSDPANEMYEEEKARKERLARGESAPMQTAAGNILCTIDTTNGSCTCIDKEMAKKLSISQQDCVNQVRKALEIKQP